MKSRSRTFAIEGPDFKFSFHRPVHRHELAEFFDREICDFSFQRIRVPGTVPVRRDKAHENGVLGGMEVAVGPALPVVAADYYAGRKLLQPCHHLLTDMDTEISCSISMILTIIAGDQDILVSSSPRDVNLKR